jgi:hypothetical protein
MKILRGSWEIFKNCGKNWENCGEKKHHELEPLRSSQLANVKSCWKMHGASSDVENGKILELSGAQSKAMSLFVRTDMGCQS